jgi:glucodextranase-like protein
VQSETKVEQAANDMRLALVLMAAMLAAVYLAGQLPTDAASGSPGDSQDSAWIQDFLANATQPQAADFPGNFPQPDPNGLLFVVRFERDVFATPYVHGSIEILSGDPVQMAILVNNSDFSSALWQPFSNTFDVTLGPADGRFEVWVGLKNRSEALGQTASMRPLRLDRLPPLIVITNPLTSTISQPTIQLQGYSPEPLSSIRFDVSNSVGVLKDQEGYRVEQWIDHDSLEFTTNWFICQDIKLAPGTNIITLRATDRAENLTNIAYTFNLNYADDTNPPVITVAWPSDGTQVSGKTFTCRGIVDDATASMSAILTDASGRTTRLRAPIERDGKFWIEHIPLTAGSNYVTILATDAAGNTSTQTLSLAKSALSLTIDPVADDLWQSAVVHVTGTVGDASYSVSVNGIQATVQNDGAWSAVGVPVNPGNTASFVAEARASGQQKAAAAVGRDIDK